MSDCKQCCCDKVASLLEDMRELQVRQVVLLEMIALGDIEPDEDGVGGEAGTYLDGTAV